MTSPEWEAANEDDSDRFPQTPHASAPESTESHERGSRVVPDPARVARYAEAIHREFHGFNPVEAIPDSPNWRHRIAACYACTDAASAVVAVADSEHAALVAEVERLRDKARETFRRTYDSAITLRRRAEAAEAEVERLLLLLADETYREEGGRIVVGQLMEARRCAEAAEAKVAKVEALHFRRPWDIRDGTFFGQPTYPDRCDLCRVAWPCATVAALADAPAEQPRPTFEQLLSDPTEQFDKDGEVGRLILGGGALSQFQAEAYQAGECGHLIEQDVQIATASVQPTRPSRFVVDLCGLPRDHSGEHVGRMSMPAEQRAGGGA